ncbi:TPA: hypothetical protein ACVU5T_002064 [Vibrio parahaemolyticus]|nr:hypothetical protein [Vibrio parahaemolyticus]
MKDKIYTARVPLYHVKFAWSNSIKALEKEFDIKPNDDDVYDDYSAFVTRRDNTIIMWLPHDKNYTVAIPHLCHESFHAAMMLSQMVGIHTNVNDDEAGAYLAEWFSKTVLDFVHEASLDNKQKKKSKGKK